MHNSRIKLRTGLEISQFGLGTATFGGMFKSMPDSDATETVVAALEAGVTFIDTAPHYGKGVAEKRIARGLSGKSRNNFQISTKVGRLLNPTEHDTDNEFLDSDSKLEREFDFSAKGVERSIKDSLERLGLDSVDIILLHDPDDYADQAINEGFPALEKMRSAGLVKAIGVGMNQCEIPTRFINETDIDVVLIAGRYSLLDRTALQSLLPAAQKRGVDVIAAGVFNSGILADPKIGATYNYAPASQVIVERAIALRKICNNHGVSITAAAMQFPLRHSAVKAILVGCRSPKELAENIKNFDAQISEEVWEEIEFL